MSSTKTEVLLLFLKKNDQLIVQTEVREHEYLDFKLNNSMECSGCNAPSEKIEEKWRMTEAY